MRHRRAQVELVRWTADSGHEDFRKDRVGVLSTSSVESNWLTNNLGIDGASSLPSMWTLID
jgi:hypothetical protein